MKKFAIWLILWVFLLAITPAGAAVEPEPIPITTLEELQNMDPAGSYILMNDLDLAGVDWTPLELSGSFDGNGHSILNLTLTRATDRLGLSFDGNWKEYETRFSGLFGFVSGKICNLKLLNVRGLVECDDPCFLAGLVGCLEGGTISNCSVTGTLELRAFDRCFGVGGLVGHGIGHVENCQTDVTLICTDTQPQADEQFLGGIYAAGFISVSGCTVNIDGYASEHGYAHNGGLAGMCAMYPITDYGTATIKDNHVTGKITFFEDVSSRRAYCEPIVGETLVSVFHSSGNTHQFIRDERYDYTTELRPEMCENPVYREEVVEGICPEYGWTVYTCESCGYTYRDHYTLPWHTPGQWTLVTEPTVESEGLEETACVTCGLILQQTIPAMDLPMDPPTEPKPQATVPGTGTSDRPRENPVILPILVGLGGCGALGIFTLLSRPRKREN